MRSAECGIKNLKFAIYNLQWSEATITVDYGLKWTVSHEPKRGVSVERVKKEIKETAQSLGIALILALIIRALVIQAFSIPSGSMEPTLQIGDMLLANKFIYQLKEPKRGDIIIFKFPYSIEKRKFFDLRLFKVPLPESIRKKEVFSFYFFKIRRPQFLYTWRDFIKRVMATEGETLEVKEGKVYINGKALSEPYIMEEIAYDYGPVKVPKDCLFVMGDNRNNSDDSHVWKFLPQKYVRAKAMVIYWPIRRIRVIR